MAAAERAVLRQFNPTAARVGCLNALAISPEAWKYQA